MALNSLLAEIFVGDLATSLGYLDLDWQPQPGAYVEVAGQMYLVLERKHRYQLRSGRYQLQQIALYVQPIAVPTEGCWQNDRWLIGDLTCHYNARSELVRCAVNPVGPCQQCGDYQAIAP